MPRQPRLLHRAPFPAASDSRLDQAVAAAEQANLFVALTCREGPGHTDFNGSRMGSSAQAFGPNDQSVFRIGAGATEGNGNYFFDGSVDEVGFYNKTLTPLQIFTHYALGAKPVAAPPILTFVRQANAIILNWNAGTLQQADQVMGPWLDVSGGSPQTFQTANQQKFYRVRQ